jgi:hypothetical protein
MNEKWKRREKKRLKKKHGMRVDGKSLFLIQRLQRERAEKIKEKRSKNA